MPNVFPSKNKNSYDNFLHAMCRRRCHSTCRAEAASVKLKFSWQIKVGKCWTNPKAKPEQNSALDPKEFAIGKNTSNEKKRAPLAGRWRSKVSKELEKKL